MKGMVYKRMAESGKRKPGLKLAVLGLCAVLLLSGCAAGGQAEQASAAVSSADTSAFGWSIQVKAVEKADSMSASKNVQKYNGDVTKVGYEKKPGDGNVFLLLNLSIEKQKADAGVFVWKDLSVQDANGQSYARMENDTFLEDFKYSRIKSTDLTLGKNEGYACFEVNKDAAEGGLYLVYQSAQGEERIKLQ